MRTAQSNMAELRDLASEDDGSEPPQSDKTSSVRTASGHQVELTDVAECCGSAKTSRVVVRRADGQVQLRILLGPEGPILQFQEAALDLHVKGELRVNAETVTLTAASRLELRSGGDIRQSANAHHEIRAGGRANVMGRDVRVVASRGDVGIKANDDVSVSGERIWLNR